MPRSVNLLIIFVTLPGNKNRIAGAGSFHRRKNRFSAVDFNRKIVVVATSEAGKNILGNSLRHLGSRIIGGNDRSVREIHHRLRHERALSTVAVSAAAEHRNESTKAERPE